MSLTQTNSPKTITITSEDLLHQIKLSYKVPEIVEQIITRKAIAAAAAEANIEVTIEELQQTADRMRAMNQLKDPQATWAWLEKHGLSLDDFEEVVHNAMISKKILAHLFTDKVEPYFYEHQLDYAGAKLYEIVLDDEDEAVELFYEIQEEEISFQEAAQQYIQDAELRRKGGYRGQVNRTEMSPEVSAAVFAANSPTLLKPIVTSKGVHLILIEEIIVPQLDNQLRHQIGFDLFSKWLKQKSESYTLALDSF